MAIDTQDTAAPTVTGYSTAETLFATRYKQGGRTVFAIALTPDQLVNMIPRPDPAASNPGNRKIRPAHAGAFAKYFEQHPDWVIPGIILRAPSIFQFEATTEVAGAQFGILSYPKRAQTDIQILDGQHRILGFHIAFKDIHDDLDKARDQLRRADRVEGKTSALYKEAQKAIKDIERRRDRLFDERVSVEIQVTDDPQAYRQMFFDIAENALGITAAVKARFDSRKAVNRALPAVLEHPLLANRVDMDIDRIGMSNPNLMSARHVVEIIRSRAVGLEGRIGKRVEKEMSDSKLAKDALDFFDLLVEKFPPLKALELGQIVPKQLRETSLIGSPLMMRILASVYHSLTTEHAWTHEMVKDYFAALAPHMVGPAHANSIWRLHLPDHIFDEGALAPNGRRQDSAALNRALIEWAIDQEKFVDEPPRPAPEPEIDPDEGIDFAPDHDTKKLDVEVRNEFEDLNEQGKAKTRKISSRRKAPTTEEK